jgi:hypothetical protein
MSAEHAARAWPIYMLSLARCRVQATMAEAFVRKSRTTAEADAQANKSVVMERTQSPPSAACFEDLAMRCEALGDQHLKQYKKHAGFYSDGAAAIEYKSSWCQEGVALLPSLVPR